MGACGPLEVVNHHPDCQLYVLGLMGVVDQQYLRSQSFPILELRACSPFPSNNYFFLLDDDDGDDDDLYTMVNHDSSQCGSTR